MAEGCEFGMDQPDLDHDLDHDDDDNDDDDEQEVNTTRPFYPGSASTPYHGGEQHEMQTMQHEQSGRTERTSRHLLRRNTFVRKCAISKRKGVGVLKGVFPESSSTSLEASYSLKGRLQVKMAGGGKKLYDLFTTKRSTGKQQLNPNLTKEIRRELGPMAREVVERDNEEIRNERKRLREAEKQRKEDLKLASEREKAAQEVQNLRNKNERVQAQIDAHTQEHGTTIESESELRRLQQLKKILKWILKTQKKRWRLSRNKRKPKPKDKPTSTNLEKK